MLSLFLLVFILNSPWVIIYNYLKEAGSVLCLPRGQMLVTRSCPRRSRQRDISRCLLGPGFISFLAVFPDVLCPNRYAVVWVSREVLYISGWRPLIYPETLFIGDIVCLVTLALISLQWVAIGASGGYITEPQACLWPASLGRLINKKKEASSKLVPALQSVLWFVWSGTSIGLGKGEGVGFLQVFIIIILWLIIIRIKCLSSLWGEKDWKVDGGVGVFGFWCYSLSFLRLGN